MNGKTLTYLVSISPTLAAKNSPQPMYVTAEEIATLIEERREMTHKEIADEINLGTSSVSQALANPSSRRLGTLVEIARAHRIEIGNEPLYEANVKKDNKQ